MFVRVNSSPNSPRKSVKIIESYREGYKVKQRHIHHVGIAANEEEVEKLKKLANEFIAREKAKQEAEDPQRCLFEPLTPEEHLAQINRLEALKKESSQRKPGRKPRITLKDVANDDLISLADLKEEDRIIEGIHDAAGHIYDDIGYNNLLDRPKDNELLRDIVLMRLANPSSKLKAQEMLSKRFAKCHDMDAVYRMMDKLFPKISEMKTITFEKTKSLLPDTVDIIFFDCTTLYFESTEVDELRNFGYSKDHRFNTTQIVLALATNGDGLPIGYEIFEGNKAEVKTLLDCIVQWRESFKIDKVCFVADRAMMSDDNLKAIELFHCTYIIAAKLRSMPLKLQEEILCGDNYFSHLFGNEVGWIGEFNYKNRRVIVSYKTARAKHDKHQRQQVLNKIQKSLGKEGETQKLITNSGVKKYTKMTKSTSKLCENKIASDERWDGMHGVITNIPAPKDDSTENMLCDLERVARAEIEQEKCAKKIEDSTHGGSIVDSSFDNKNNVIEPQEASKILGRYGCLWKIEESFRVNKNTLSMRPIFHFKPDRIRAHIGICYMAFTVLRHMEYRVKLTQKISLETMLDELMNVQSSIYVHQPTGRRYRMPGKFTQNASKIYKALNMERINHAQEIIEHMT